MTGAGGFERRFQGQATMSGGRLSIVTMLYCFCQDGKNYFSLRVYPAILQFIQYILPSYNSFLTIPKIHCILNGVANSLGKLRIMCKLLSRQ